jgi:two-component system cell cycle sensor histidine kinase/response regulator CckA
MSTLSALRTTFPYTLLSRFPKEKNKDLAKLIWYYTKRSTRKSREIRMYQETAPEKDIQAGIVREQVNLALRDLPTMQLASFVVALVLAYTVRTAVPRTHIFAWIGMVLAIVTSRIVLYFRYVRVRQHPFDGTNWKNVYVLLALMSGVIWGLSSFIIFPSHNLGLISLFVLVIASLSAATTVSHSSLRLGPLAWMAPALLFYSVRCFIEGGETEYTIGILIIIYLITLTSYSFNHHRTITAAISLRFENLKLLEEVRRSAERFRLLFQKHTAVMLLVDPDTGQIVDANAAAERFYGYPSGELRRMHIEDINTLSEEEVRSIRFKTLREDRNYFVFPHRLANGDIRTVEVHSSPIQTEEKVLLFSIIHDITERKQAEERLRESEASYRNLFNSITDAIFIQDEQGRFLDVNKGTEDMYGYGRDFFLNKTAEQFSVPGMYDRSAAAAAIRRAYNGEPQMLDFWGMRSDGTAFPQEVRLMPATYGGRSVVIAVSRDISERKRAEAELLRAQKLEAIGVLAGGIAHDFNNLLQGVFGFLTVAKLKIDQRDKAVLMLDKAEKALQMSVNLTSQLLTFSKGGQPVKRTMFLVSVMENATRFALSGSRSDCRFALADDLWPVEADEGQIGQVIQNIVLNADQAMPSGGIVTVAASNIDRGAAPSPGVPGPGRWVRIEIMDTGEGIPEECISRIFEPYFTTKKGGSGLGLAMAYSIVKNHGGMIEVMSVADRGSCFTIWLPASDSAVPASRQTATSTAVRSGRVLVMDDEEVVRDSVGEMLRALGQEVVFANDGAIAVEQYRAAQAAGSPFTVVILDATVRGGGMSGEEAIRRLREIDPGVIAIVSSGYSDEALVSNYADHGFKAFLHKPFSFDGLRTALGSVRH